MFSADTDKYQAANFFSLYEASSTLQGFWTSVTKAPEIFVNGFYAGTLSVLGDKEIESSTLDPSKLVLSEAETESSMSELLSQKYKELLKSFEDSYESRKRWYDDLESSIGDKTLYQLIQEKYIDAPEAHIVAIRAAIKRFGFFDTDYADETNIMTADFAGVVSVFLKQVSRSGELCGEQLGYLIQYLGGEETLRNISESLPYMILLSKTFEDISSTAAKIPMDVFWAGLGGSIEGLESFLRGVGTEKSDSKSMTLGDFQEWLEKEVATMEEAYKSARRTLTLFDKTFTEKSFSDIYVRNVSAGRKSDEVILRYALSKSGQMGREYMEMSDSIRAGVKGARRYVGQTVAGFASSATKSGLDVVHSIGKATYSGITGLAGVVQNLSPNFSLYHKKREIENEVVKEKKSKSSRFRNKVSKKSFNITSKKRVCNLMRGDGGRGA